MRVRLWVLGLSLVAALTLLLLDDAPSPMATTLERAAAASPTRDLQSLDAPSRERRPAPIPDASVEGLRWLWVMATLPNGAPAAAADAKGQASIRVAPETSVCVRSGDLYGEAEVPTGTSEVRVTLLRDVTLRVPERHSACRSAQRQSSSPRASQHRSDRRPSSHGVAQASRPTGEIPDDHWPTHPSRKP